MTTRFERYLRKQLKNPDMRALVEKELASLNIGVQVAKLRQKRSLNQTQLAARAHMSAPKISRLENKSGNVELDTLIRVAEALGARLEVRLVEERDNRRRKYAAAGA